MEISQTIVRSDFNEIAILIQHDILEYNIFVQEYWWIILKIWYKVEPKIIERRDGSTIRHSDSMISTQTAAC